MAMRACGSAVAQKSISPRTRKVAPVRVPVVGDTGAGTARRDDAADLFGCVLLKLVRMLQPTDW
jgi:hypothetical protein